MEQYYEQIKNYEANLQKECLKISVIFDKIADLMTEFKIYREKKDQSNKKNLLLSSDVNNELNEEKKIFAPISNKRKYFKQSDCWKNKNKGPSLKNIGYGKVYRVFCTENNNKIIGYNVRLKYYKLFFTLGPYKSSNFATNVNQMLQKQVSTLKLNKRNYRILLFKCMSNVKSALDKEFPPLELYKTAKTNNKIPIHSENASLIEKEVSIHSKVEEKEQK